MRKKKQRNLLISIIALIALFVLGFFSFGGTNLFSKGTAQAKTVKIGIMSGTKKDDQVWNKVAQIAKKRYNITLKFTKFTDYSQPNKALANGSIDLNAFQHYAFLKSWNKANKSDIVSIGNTIITPVSLYSTKYKKVSQIPDGATIAVPNDASNESRALFVLKNAGLIKLKSNKTTVTVKDITSNPKHLKIKELDASQTAHSLSNVAAAIINTNYALAAKISTSKIIYTEPINKDSEQWINLIAANKKDRNNKTYKQVVKAYQSKAVKQLIKKLYGNQEVAAWDIKLK